MRAALEWARRLLGTLRRRRSDADLEEELKLHLDFARESRVGKEAPSDTARAMRLQLGAVAQTMDAMRDQRGVPWLETFGADVRYAVRLLRRAPVFSAVAVLSLALGIGATAAIFSLLNAIVLRPLPAVAHPESLVQLVYTLPTAQGSRNWSSYFDYPQLEQFSRQTRTMSGIFGGTSLGRVAVALDGHGGLATCDAYTASMFTVLGLSPELGRFFTADEDRHGSTVAVISDGYWRTRFGADPSIVGRSIGIDGAPFTIVGVTPRGFQGLLVGASRDIWVPLHALIRIHPNATDWLAPFGYSFSIVGRLRDGVALRQAASELDVLYRRLAAQELAASDRRSSALAQQEILGSHLLLHPAATGITNALRNEYATPLQLLLAAAGVVLLIACANVATLVLARASRRRHEIALRMALGSGRGRVVRQMLSESVLLAAAGGMAALAVAWWGGAALVRMVSTGDTPLPLDVRPDWRVLVFTAAVTVMSGVLFGLAPALCGARVDPGPALKDGDRGAHGRARRLDRVLVVAQVAFSVVLLSGAVMFTRSLQKLRGVDVGYDRDDVLMFSTAANLSGYSKAHAAVLYRRLLQKLSGAPGVEAASASIVRPIDDAFFLTDGVDSIDGRRLPERDQIAIDWNLVAPGYFRTLRIPFVLGRDFSPMGDACAFMCIVIDESLARKAFPGQNPIGHRLSDAEIIGVVKDTRYHGIQDQQRPVIYRPLFEATGPYDAASWITGDVSFEIRYRADAGLIDAVREAVASVDPSLPIFRIKTVEEQTDDSLIRERLLVVLSDAFGGLALLLACLGLYGLLAYGVSRRTAEIGLRMALGASRGNVVWLVLRASLVLAGVGAAAGIPLSFWAARFVRSLVFDVTPAEPLVIAAPIIVMAIVAGVAALVPARRASRIDPAVALRSE